MNRFAYRIHYQEDPQRIGHIPMDSTAVNAALCGFRDALPRYLRELNASAEIPEAVHRHGSAIRIIVRTELDWAKVSLAMNGYADRHGLRATHVARGPLAISADCVAREARRYWPVPPVTAALTAAK